MRAPRVVPRGLWGSKGRLVRYFPDFPPLFRPTMSQPPASQSSRFALRLYESARGLFKSHGDNLSVVSDKQDAREWAMEFSQIMVRRRLRFSAFASDFCCRAAFRLRLTRPASISMTIGSSTPSS